MNGENGWLNDWMVFYSAFNGISVMNITATAHIIYFFPGFYQY